MYFNFGALPPEINSANMYSGAGPDSMFAVAAEWENMSYAMGGMPRQFAEAVAVLQERWLSPSAIRVAEAAAPYRKWLNALCQQIHRTAEQAYRLVEAHSDAREMMVPPDAIARNRARLQTLIADNVFGIHAGAIAVLEEQYQRFWVWDVAVMEAYAVRVLHTLSEMTPWQAPPEITSELEMAPGSVAAVYRS